MIRRKITQRLSTTLLSVNLPFFTKVLYYGLYVSHPGAGVFVAVTFSFVPSVGSGITVVMLQVQ